jgi:hypothetical protein
LTLFDPIPKTLPIVAALPTLVVLRILIVLNWLSGAAILALLVAMPNRQWIMSALALSPSPEADRLIMGLRAIAVLGLAAIPLNYVVLKRLLAIVETFAQATRSSPRTRPVCRRSPGRCSRCSCSASSSAPSPETVSTPAHPVDLDAGFSINGWLAVLLTFLLARVFAEGTRMREDLEGTV